MRTFSRFAGLLLLFFACALSGAEVKYVFLLIGDGFGPNQRILAETALGRKLLMNTSPCVTPTGTNTFDGKTTDSAASGTAISCGIKTHLYAIGTDKDDHAVEGLASELKRTKKFSVGILSSCGMTDATPAAQYAHRKNRALYREIADDMVASPFDLFGGYFIFESEDIAGKGKLETEFRKKLADAGRTVLTGPDALKELTADRRFYVAEPPLVKWNADDARRGITLAEYLKGTAELFESNPNGFFIMLECGRIDHAGHNNDSGMTVREVAALDEALSAALDFQKRHPEETLIVLTADHETGGLKIDDLAKLQANCALLFKQTMQLEQYRPKVDQQIRAKTSAAEIVAGLEKMLGIEFTETEKQELAGMVDNNYLPKTVKIKRPNAWTIVKKAAALRDTRLGIRYTTGGHTNTKILTNAFGPGWKLFADRPLENADLRGVITAILNGQR